MPPERLPFQSIASSYRTHIGMATVWTCGESDCDSTSTTCNGRWGTGTWYCADCWARWESQIWPLPFAASSDRSTMEPPDPCRDSNSMVMCGASFIAGLALCENPANMECAQCLCNMCGHTIFGHVAGNYGGGCGVHGEVIDLVPRPEQFHQDHSSVGTAHRELCIPEQGQDHSGPTSGIELSRNGEDMIVEGSKQAEIEDASQTDIDWGEMPGVGQAESDEDAPIDHDCVLFCSAVRGNLRTGPVVWIGQNSFLVRHNTDAQSPWDVVCCHTISVGSGEVESAEDVGVQVSACDCTNEGRETQRILRVTKNLLSEEAVHALAGRCIHCRLVGAVPKEVRRKLAVNGGASAAAELLPLEAGVFAVQSKAVDGQLVWGVVRTRVTYRGSCPWSCDTCKSKSKNPCHHVHTLLKSNNGEEDQVQNTPLVMSPASSKGGRYAARPPAVPAIQPRASHKRRYRTDIGPGGEVDVGCSSRKAKLQRTHGLGLPRKLEPPSINQCFKCGEVCEGGSKAAYDWEDVVVCTTQGTVAASGVPLDIRKTAGGGFQIEISEGVPRELEEVGLEGRVICIVGSQGCYLEAKIGVFQFPYISLFHVQATVVEDGGGMLHKPVQYEDLPGLGKVIMCIGPLKLWRPCSAVMCGGGANYDGVDDAIYVAKGGTRMYTHEYLDIALLDIVGSGVSSRAVESRGQHVEEFLGRRSEECLHARYRDFQQDLLAYDDRHVHGAEGERDVDRELSCPYCKGKPRILILDGTMRGVDRGKLKLNEPPKPADDEATIAVRR